MSATHPPLTVEAGTTVTFATGKYSSATYTLQAALNNGVDAPLVVNGVVSGDIFTVTFEAPAVPGSYVYGEVYTKIADGTTYTGCHLTTIQVTPSILTQATPSQASKMVTILERVLLEFAASPRQSVSFNGQSFSRASIGEYQDQLTFWKAQLLAEQAKFTGRNITRSIAPRFVPPQCNYPFGHIR